MGLKRIARIREYVDFDIQGRVVKMFEVVFTTEKTQAEFTLDIKAEEYSADEAKKRAAAKAAEIDKAIG